MKILLYKTQPEIIKSQIFMRFNVIHLLIVKRLSNEFAMVCILHKRGERILLSRSFKRKRSINIKPSISKQNTEILEYEL